MTSSIRGLASMLIIFRVLLMTSFLAFAACGTTGSADGAATDNAGYGRVKIGMPF